MNEPELSHCQYPDKTPCGGYEAGCRCPDKCQAWQDARNARKRKRRDSSPLLQLSHRITSIRGKARQHGYAEPNFKAEEIVGLFERTTHCECCDYEFAPDMKDSRIDHCHVTGAFRGFLCDACNVGLGRCRDNPDILRRWITYLEGGTDG